MSRTQGDIHFPTCRGDTGWWNICSVSVKDSYPGDTNFDNDTSRDDTWSWNSCSVSFTDLYREGVVGGGGGVVVVVVVVEYLLLKTCTQENTHSDNDMQG